MVLVRHQSSPNLRVVRGYGRSWRTLCQQRGKSTLEIWRWIHKLTIIGRRTQRLQSVVSIQDQLRQGLHPLLRSLQSQAALQASKLVEHILFCEYSSVKNISFCMGIVTNRIVVLEQRSWLRVWEVYCFEIVSCKRILLKRIIQSNYHLKLAQLP
jgi:hypothetical protein